MKIENVEVRLYRIPPALRWEDATHRVNALEYIITQLHTDTGLTGVGFAYTTGIGGSSILSLISDYCAPLLAGADPLRVRELWSFLHNQLHRCGTGGINTLALGAIDIALWDLAAQHYGQPLYKLLGAARASVAAYGSGIDLFMAQDELLEHVESMMQSGFKTIKIKIGKEDPEEDYERVRAVRELIGSKRNLAVDANQRWTVPEAISRLKLLESISLLWLEEPLDAEDVHGHSEVRRLTGIPLAAGESLYTKHQFLDYLGDDAMDIVQADVCRVGGITEWLRIANVASAFHRPVIPHYLAELSVTLLCSVENGLMVECVRGGTFTEMGILQNPMRIANGVATPTETPGHGIKFDFGALAPYEVSLNQLQTADLRTAK